MPVRALLLKQNWNFIQIRKSKEHYLDKVQQPFAGKTFRLVLCILLRYALIKRSTVEKKKQMIFFFFLVLSELLYLRLIPKGSAFFFSFILGFQGIRLSSRYQLIPRRDGGGVTPYSLGFQPATHINLNKPVLGRKVNLTRRVVRIIYCP